MQELVNGLHQVPAAETADVGDTTGKRRVSSVGEVNDTAPFAAGHKVRPCDAREDKVKCIIFIKLITNPDCLVKMDGLAAFCRIETAMRGVSFFVFYGRMSI